MVKGLVSIIIPVYNVEKYLEECLNSIINQSYKKIEVILIDDGSTDNSAKICNKYSQKNEKIICIHKKNEGVSKARNVGIEKANGEYVLFVDSDDWLDTNMIEIMYNTLENEKLDIVSCNYTLDYEDRIEKNLYIREEIIEGEKIYEYLFSNEFYHGYLWNKLIKREIIGNVRFDERVKICEDILFLSQILKSTKKMVYLGDKYLYHYRQRSNSAVNFSYSLKDITRLIPLKQFIENNYNIDFLHYDYVMLTCRSKYILKKHSKYTKKEKKKYNLEIKKNYKKALKEVNIKGKLKIILWMLFPMIIGKLLDKNKTKKEQQNMKIAILTINDDVNLGNRLQNYASQQVLNKYGKVETINNQDNVYGYKYKIKKIKNFIKKILPLKRFERYNNFMSFNKNISYSKIAIDRNHISNSLNRFYDAFIVGSDQVWNYTFPIFSELYLLNFVEEKLKISFSASIGLNDINDENKKVFTDNLKSFNYISVREYRAKEIVEEITGRKDIEVLVDPTMLLSREEWDKVSKKPKMLENKKFILCYFLGSLSEQRKKEINRVAKEKNCEIINILDSNSPFYSCGPSEFLYLEKKASLICTDSFHSSVFAIIYDRPLIIFDREDKEEKMNSRLDTLIKKFKLKNRKYNNKRITEENLNHDYTEAYKILENERNKSSLFLNKALNSKSIKKL